MHRILALILIAVGLLHLYPAVGVFGPGRLQALYDIGSSDPDTLLLLRHRAVLFALLGIAMIAGGIHTPWRWPALIAGLVSTLSFVVLAFPLSDNSAAVTRVFWSDVVASALLMFAVVLAIRYRTPHAAASQTAPSIASPASPPPPQK
ncbi:MAG: hypothetical protein ABIP49_02370 [Lysobacterales bacterium]